MPDSENEFAFAEQVPIPLETVLGTPLPPRAEPLPEAPLDSPGSAEELLDYSSLLKEKDSGGIEILVQMAHKGELDPKNIDIIDATDRFLKAIAAAPRENLRRSGKIIFHASVLLRLKAEALLITKIEDFDAVTDDYLDFDVEGSPLIYDSNDEEVGRQITLADLQRALVRRSKQRQSRQRRVTLEQLIESLREAERLEKKRNERRERDREPKAVIEMDGYHDMDDMDDILDLAHDEDIETVIERIEQLLVKKMEEMLRLSLRELIGMLDGRGDWVDAFLAVLFLSNSGKLNLEQEIFYGPLYLVKNTGLAETLAATGTDAVAVETQSAASATLELLPSPDSKDSLSESDKKRVPVKKKSRKSKSSQPQTAAALRTDLSAEQPERLESIEMDFSPHVDSSFESSSESPATVLEHGSLLNTEES
ncbi:MAG: segregation/condensation protein A [Candidatus Obscuribacterales bacterium]|nr:segregation/condensation protein A [Candidatus Obscuribacterales bacterium]